MSSEQTQQRPDRARRLLPDVLADAATVGLYPRVDLELEDRGDIAIRVWNPAMRHHVPMDSTPPVTTVQLRRYQIEPSRMAAHLAWFPTIRAAREEFGFRVLFALADTERNIFTWAVAVAGDRERFAAVDAAWMVSPGRAAAFQTNPKAVTSMETDIVTDALSAAVGAA